MSDPDGSPVHRSATSQNANLVLTTNPDPEEARLEARELSRYLLAKSFFDCKEYDRCAAVFIKDNLPSPPISGSANATPNRKGKGKASANLPLSPGRSTGLNKLPNLSQKALFLSFYAKFMAGEKRRDEESEIILGPVDAPTTVNKELAAISQKLSGWCYDRVGWKDTEPGASQGWLDFLYVWSSSCGMSWWSC